jgi:hypothetical protein
MAEVIGVRRDRIARGEVRRKLGIVLQYPRYGVVRFVLHFFAFELGLLARYPRWEVVRFVLQFFVFELLIPQAEERIEDAFAGAAKLRLVTAEQVQSAGIVTQGAEGKRGTGYFVYGFVLLIDGVSLFRHFEVEERCLDGPDALHAPAGGDQLLDETGLDFALRVELREISFEQFLEV